MEEALAIGTLAYEGGKAAHSGYKWLTKPKKATRSKTAFNKKKYMSFKEAQARQDIALASLNRQMKMLKTAHNADTANHTHRRIFSGSALSSAQSQFYHQIVINRPSTIEDSCGSFRFFDPTTPTALVTASAVTGTFSRKLNVKNVSASCVFRNNYIVPLHARFYWVSPKDDTTQSPLVSMDNSLQDQMATAVDRTHPGVYPTDLDMFNSQWNIVKTVNKTIQPGSECELKWNSGNFTYDPSIFDTETDNYQKSCKTVVLMIKIQGVVAHDASGNEGYTQAGLDYVCTVTSKFEYDAGGVSLNDLTFDNELPTFIGAQITGNKPAADNQNYSSL